MLANASPQSYQRRSLRRAVSIDCEIESDLWDGQVPFRVTDLSDDGLWLRTGLSIECGEQLLVSFAPPRWPKPQPLVALASVVRVAMPRRRSDGELSGMALQLLDLEPEDRQLLRSSLHGLPPRLRVEKVRGAKPADSEPTPLCPMSYILSHESRFVLTDGTEIDLVAEAPLLTGGRAHDKARIHVRAAETKLINRESHPLLRLAS